MSRPVRLGLIGYGTVGRGVAKILRESKQLIESRVGAPVELVRIASRSDKRAELKRAGFKGQFSRDARDVISDPDVDVLVELIGGYEPARTLVLQALQAGKHVVTANKALLAKYWGDVFDHARLYQRLVYFEGAVGGGIPVIQALNEGLAGNRFRKIAGILNGTTNYVLTRMTQAGLSYADALKEAQVAGFAEADPSFDVEGTDAAHKIAILASIASGAWVPVSQVQIEGITKLDPRDIAFVKKEFGYVVKLLGTATFAEDAVDVRVHPTLISQTHPFANVQNEYNAVSIEGSNAGDVILYGKGAGSLPAASAVISDIIYVARHVVAGTAGKLPYVQVDATKRMKASTAPISRYYLRFMVSDRPGVLAGITQLLSKAKISIAGIYQPEHGFADRGGAAILMLTHPTSDATLRQTLARIAKLSSIKAKPVSLRIAEEQA